MNDLEKLLNQVYPIIVKDNAEKEAQLQRGELFNVFRVLKLTSDEVRTHSAFLAELLNPNGSHGMSDKFLRLFIRTIPELKDMEFDTLSAKVFVEYYIGEINKEGTEGGRLDILIESRTNAIVLENKIYAGDQPKQLLRYHNYVQKYKKSFLLYLTLDRHSPSEDSTDNKKFDYIPIGYNSEILEWLDQCRKEAAMKPTLRETISQYIHLIKQLTNQDTDMAQEITKLVAGEETYARSAIEIIRAKDKIQTTLLTEMWNKVYENIKKPNQEDNIKWVYNNESLKDINDFHDKIDGYYKNKPKPHGLEIVVGNWKEYTLNFRIEVEWNLYYGFVLRKNGEFEIQNDIRKEIKDKFEEFESKWENSDDWICWKYPDFHDKNDKCNFKDFNSIALDFIYNKNDFFDNFIKECKECIDQIKQKIGSKNE